MTDEEMIATVLRARERGDSILEQAAGELSNTILDDVLALVYAAEAAKFVILNHAELSPRERMEALAMIETMGTHAEQNARVILCANDMLASKGQS